MARYIDADKLWNDRPRIPKVQSMDFIAGFDKCMFDFGERIKKQIDNPTADVAEVKHGYWIKHRDNGDCEYIECSACGEEFYPPNNEFEFDKYPKHCQECGAKMDGEVKGGEQG